MSFFCSWWNLFNFLNQENPSQKEIKQNKIKNKNEKKELS